MDFIIILSLCLLSTAKVSIQGVFAKINIKNNCDAILFNTLVFLFSTVIFITNIKALNFPVFIFATSFGILTVFFQTFYINAMKCGNVSLTVLIVNLSMVIPIITSILFYNEKLSVLRFSGIVLTFLSLILSVDKTVKKTNFKKWFFLSLTAALFNGGLAVCQKIFTESEWKNQIKSFVACSYAVAAAVSFIFYLFLKHKKISVSYKFNLKLILYSLSIGLILGVFQALNTKAISVIDGTVFFPAYYGGALITAYISSILIFKEKLKQKQKLSLLIGIVAIVLMNL